jgi:soluble lytic murein transglycosylase-like protein
MRLTRLDLTAARRYGAASFRGGHFPVGCRTLSVLKGCGFRLSGSKTSATTEGRESMRHAALVLLLLATLAPSARAEYIVLRSGQRLTVTGYQLLGDTYRLQMTGGYLEMPAADVVSIEPEEVFTPAPPAETAKAPFRDLIQAAADRYSVDADLITSVIAVESNFDAKAISRRNARGLMQLLPETAQRLGVHNIFDPSENIDAGTHYLRDLLALYRNDLALTLAAYNAGPERVQQYGRRIPPFRETQSYVQRVRRAYAQRKSAAPSVTKPPAQSTVPPVTASATTPIG